MPYMVVYLCHSDQVLRVRTSSTCECDGQFTQEKSLLQRDFRLADHSLWHLPAPSLPLCSSGSKHSWPRGSSRTQERFYCQAVGLLDPASPSACATTGQPRQSVGGSRVAALIETSARPWLSASDSARFVAKITMCMIVCRLKRCRAFIIGWCLMKLNANRRPS